MPRSAVFGKPVLAVFRLTNDSLDGDHTFPAPLTVFGNLKATSISIFQGTDEESGSHRQARRCDAGPGGQGRQPEKGWPPLHPQGA